MNIDVITQRLNKETDRDRIISLIKVYLDNVYPLWKLNFSGDKKEIVKEALLKNVVKLNSYDAVSIAYLTEFGYDDVIKKFENTYFDSNKTYDLALLTNVYDENYIKHLYNTGFGIRINELYAKTHYEMILKTVLELFKQDQEFEGMVEIYKAFLINLNNDKLKFLNILIEKVNYENIESLFNILPSEDKLYVVDSLIKKENTSNLLYKLLLDEKLNPEYQSKVIKSICVKKEIKYVYKTLLLDNLNDEEKKSLENVLYNSNNFEYKLYYDFYQKRDSLLLFYGNLMALLVYLELNEKLFLDKKELLGVENEIKTLLEEEKKTSINSETSPIKKLFQGKKAS